MESRPGAQKSYQHCLRCLWKVPFGAGDHVPHISDQFIAYTGNTDLAILLNKDTFEPDPKVLTFKVDSTSKSTCCMVLLIVRGLLKPRSLSGWFTDCYFLLSTYSQCRG